jgi:hypothetical protein
MSVMIAVRELRPEEKAMRRGAALADGGGFVTLIRLPEQFWDAPGLSAMARSTTSWFTVGFDAWVLGMEAAAVIAQRSLILAQGGAQAQAEAVRMVAEKAEATTALAMRAALGDLGQRPVTVSGNAVRHYRTKVRANRKRLAKKAFSLTSPKGPSRRGGRGRRP